MCRGVYYKSGYATGILDLKSMIGPENVFPCVGYDLDPDGNCLCNIDAKRCAASCGCYARDTAIDWEFVPFINEFIPEVPKAAFGYMDCDSDAASNLRKAISAIEPPVHFQSDFRWNWPVCKAGHEETKTAIIKYVTCPECLAFIAKIAADYAGRKTS